mgnify:CR=1 FL=1
MRSVGPLTTGSSDKPLALRLDDVGASSKRYEVYSKRYWRLGPLHLSGDRLFLKYLPGIKAWGPYRELSAREWSAILERLSRSSAVLTVAVTAAWAERENVLIPFPARCPAQAAVLRDGVRANLIEVANHGLTHCVLAGNNFRPKIWSGNRLYHREFWEWVPPEIQERHLRQSQDILQDYFQIPVVTFVPPGNVFTAVTLEIASRYGLRYVSCDTEPRLQGQLVIVGNSDVAPFHDRDIVHGGLRWLDDRLAEHAGRSFCFVRDLAARMEQPVET